MSAFVLADEADNLRYGIDLRDWATRGLVDEIHPGTGIGGSPARQLDMKFHNEVCRAKGDAPDAMGNDFPPWAPRGLTRHRAGRTMRRP